jgi:CubicO group peptidase (beta-lactamase class C family)
MFTRQKYRHNLPIICSVIIFLVSFYSRSSTAESAESPLATATPESQNLSKVLLDEAVVEISKGNYGDINSLLVMRNQYLVLEEYFSPQYHGRDYMQTMRSATKSIASILIGIAIEQGKISGVQTKLLDYFTQYENLKNMDLRKKEITLEQILTMTSGIQWAEIPYSNPQNDVYKMHRSQDWVRFVLDSPMSQSPAHFVYNSGGSILLGGILQHSTGKSAEDFAAEYLFKPLGIQKWTWSLAPKGVTNTGWGLTMKRRNMLRLGLLALNGGRWFDNQIVAKKWLQISTRSHVTTGNLDTESAQYEYGYQWWRFTDRDPTVGKLSTNDVYFAWGYGGQFIFVIPHLNMVVVSTGDNYGADYRLFFDVLRDYIFPAVLE